jgi:hypothetical protein
MHIEDIIIIIMLYGLLGNLHDMMMTMCMHMQCCAADVDIELHLRFGSFCHCHHVIAAAMEVHNVAASCMLSL